MTPAGLVVLGRPPLGGASARRGSDVDGASMPGTAVCGPMPGVCNACWLFSHSSCERRLSCVCGVCHPGRGFLMGEDQEKGARVSEGYVWNDELIWCPSQCRCNVTAPDGTKAVLYLRWRWGDPWTGTIIVGLHEDGISDIAKGEWHDPDIGEWRSDQLDEAKAALIKAWERSPWMLNNATPGEAHTAEAQA